MSSLERLRRLQGRLIRITRKRTQILKDLKHLDRLYKEAKAEADELIAQLKKESV